MAHFTVHLGFRLGEFAYLMTGREGGARGQQERSKRASENKRKRRAEKIHLHASPSTRAARKITRLHKDEVNMHRIAVAASTAAAAAAAELEWQNYRSRGNM
jgi:hypothetical protein